MASPHPRARFVVPMLLLACLPACREDGPVVPAAAVKHVMTSVTEPAAKEIFEAAAEPPQDAAGWRKVRDAAAATTASARQLLKAVRGGNRDDWLGLANAMAGAANKAAVAAAAADAAALAAAGDALYASCENCHKRFQPAKPQEAAVQSAAGGR